MWKSNEFYITRELTNERPMQVQSYERMKLSHDPLPSEWINRQFRIFPPIIDFHIVQLGTMRMKVGLISKTFFQNVFNSLTLISLASLKPIIQLFSMLCKFSTWILKVVLNLFRNYISEVF